MIKRKIKESVLKLNPYEKWNQFIDLIVAEDYKDLDEIQKIAHLCFLYDEEVQNGGHVLYFTNMKGVHLNETLEALNKIGAVKQKKVLLAVINLHKTLELNEFNTTEDYINEVLIGYDYEFPNDDKKDKFDDYIDKYDNEYYDCEPSTTDLLEEYFTSYEECFIEVLKD